MERKHYIGGVQRFSTEDGEGIRTTIFIKGCPLGCKWCHNPELMALGYNLQYKSNKCILCGGCINTCKADALMLSENKIAIDLDKCTGCGKCVENCCADAMTTSAKEYTMPELIEIIEKDMSYYKFSSGGVTLSGGEILFNSDYALEIASEVKKRDIFVDIETSGYGKYEDLYNLALISDQILYDIKLMDRELHKKYVGVYPELIWDNITKLSENEAIREKIIVRLPCIHNVNDDIENMNKVGKFMEERGLKKANLLPYHNMGVSKARQIGIEQMEFETPSDDTLKTLKNVLEKYGVNVEIMGDN